MDIFMATSAIVGCTEGAGSFEDRIRFASGGVNMAAKRTCSYGLDKYSVLE
ncbi:MAG: hypothetical protein J6M56_03535 [Clostridia bacterium]|nr:hypothetical protein [Clostridia bacterium]